MFTRTLREARAQLSFMKRLWMALQTPRCQRIWFGTRSFSLSVSYEDDFGVNAGLKTSVAKAGLELGGKFEDHQATVWRLAGEFAPRESSA